MNIWEEVLELSTMKAPSRESTLTNIKMMLEIISVVAAVASYQIVALKETASLLTTGCLQASETTAKTLERH